VRPRFSNFAGLVVRFAASSIEAFELARPKMFKLPDLTVFTAVVGTVC
jgi:hypothetical protein